MKLLLLSSFLIFTQIVKAQITKDSLLNKMGKEICTTLEEKMKDSMYLKNASQEELAALIQPAIFANLSDIQALYGENKGEDMFRVLGYDLALRLIPKCPAFAAVSVKLAKEKKFADDENIKYTPPRIVDKIEVDPPKMSEKDVIGAPINNVEEETVTLVSINPGDITTLTVKNKKGKIEKLYWFEYFENADELKNNSKKFIGKKVTITTSSKDVYNAATKKYKVIKIIEYLDLAY